MKRTLVAFAGLATFAIGCGPSRPPNQLVDARVAYQQAIANPGAPLASNDVFEARQSLEEAEKAFQEGDKDKAKNLAYLAHRKALVAQSKADALRATETKRVAIAEFQRAREAQATATRAELERAKGALTIAQQEAEAQRQARTAAEAKVTQIEGIQAQQSERGLVLTLSGSILFPSGKSELLPSAKERLTEVAKALKDDNRSLLVVGHTDAQGSDAANEKLSEDRAKAVRVFLISQGIEDQRVRSEGMGESQPVADNASAEGRANNRRVEIVLEKSPGSGHTEAPPKAEQPEKKAKEPAKKPLIKKDQKAAPKGEPKEPPK
ncbi:MAG TPA: OmpA family protein [Labilithrix sp.]|nr:OmpA family protein [Labilithrix sp.]